MTLEIDADDADASSYDPGVGGRYPSRVYHFRWLGHHPRKSLAMARVDRSAPDDADLSVHVVGGRQGPLSYLNPRGTRPVIVCGPETRTVTLTRISAPADAGRVRRETVSD
ncbi:MAG: hypothetical protein Ct9H300mP16_13320 [Pseudomonadota bacterium]|nr:MAG: hypothetical protein Ct9H300mP16_13320 [Pseudomonadota bacterium]